MSKGRIKEKVDRYGTRYKPEHFLIKDPTTTTIPKIYKYGVIDKPVAIFIDQLNKVQAKGQKEYEQFTNAARGLKELAGRLRIPIFCLGGRHAGSDGENNEGKTQFPKPNEISFSRSDSSLS